MFTWQEHEEKRFLAPGIHLYWWEINSLDRTGQDQTVKSHLKNTNNQSYHAKFNWPKFLLLFNRLCMSKTTHALKQSSPHQSLNRAFHLPLLLHPSLITASWVRMEKCLSASGFTVSLWHTRSKGSREENRDGERNTDSKSKIKWTLCSIINNEVQLRFAFTSFSFSCLEYRNMRRKQCFSLTMNFAKVC